ncbi:MAG: HDOD domain-containing protein [Dehalococcoidia bacterium]
MRTLLMEVDAFVEARRSSRPTVRLPMLRAANSAASAVNTPIVRVGDALVRIGFRNARSLVIAALLRSQGDALDGSGLDLAAFWDHLLATGLIAVAASPPGDGRSAAFTAGMLHDVGRLAMAAIAPGEYARVVHLARTGVPTLEAEREVFGTDHLETGLVAAGSWSLPPDLTTAITSHHGGCEEPVAAAVATARRIAGLLGYGDGVRPSNDPGLLEEAYSDDARILSSLGGPEALARRVAWFRTALAS